MRLLITLLVLALSFYAFFDCARTPQEEVAKLPKWAWLLLIFLFSSIGAILWLAIGRPKRNPGSGRSGKGKIIPPDDDPDFLRKL
ncbi:MAG: PLD nuclease N-terminal domain-containing protein [Candidatus Nanopelagicaceae bacterium]